MAIVVGLIFAVLIFGLILRIVSLRLSHVGAFELEEILRTQFTEYLARVPIGYVIGVGLGTIKKIILDHVRYLYVFVADSTPNKTTTEHLKIDNSAYFFQLLEFPQHARIARLSNKHQ